MRAFSWFIASTSPLGPHRLEAAGEPCGVSFIRIAIPIVRAYELIISQRPHILISWHQALEFQRMNVGDTTSNYMERFGILREVSGHWEIWGFLGKNLEPHPQYEMFITGLDEGKLKRRVSWAGWRKDRGAAVGRWNQGYPREFPGCLVVRVLCFLCQVQFSSV